MNDNYSLLQFLLNTAAKYGCGRSSTFLFFSLIGQLQTTRSTANSGFTDVDSLRTETIISQFLGRPSSHHICFHKALSQRLQISQSFDEALINQAFWEGNLQASCLGIISGNGYPLWTRPCKSGSSWSYVTYMSQFCLQKGCRRVNIYSTIDVSLETGSW